MNPVDRIHRGSEVRIVVLLAEERLVAPERVVRHHDAVADTIFQHQFRIHAPLVLDEAFEHVAAEQGVGTRADFAVRIEQAQRGVRDSGL